MRNSECIHRDDIKSLHPERVMNCQSTLTKNGGKHKHE